MRSINLFLIGASCLYGSVVAASPTATPAEKYLEFKTDEKSLYENLKSTNTNTRIRSAIFLWNNFPAGRSAAEKVMENDGDPDVRRRIAQVLASKQKNQKAIKVLRASLEGIDIKKQAGAMSYLISAGSLQEATSEVIGIDKALQILSAPSDWFSDVNGAVKAYAQKDAVRIMAASYLAGNVDAKRKPQFQDELRTYIANLEANIKNSKGPERKYWEARLPTALDIGLRVGMNKFVASFEGKRDLFLEAYEKERFLRVVERAKSNP